MSGGVPAGKLGPAEARAREPEAFAQADRIVAMYRFSTRDDEERAHEVARIALHRPATPTPPIEGRDADVERVDRAIEMVLHHSNLNGTTAQIEQAARQIRAALQALGERE